MLELRLLTSFARIAEAKSLTKAAVSLDVSQSVLSRQVRALEETLGYRVFYRTGRGVELTESGKELFTRVQDLLMHAAQLTDDAKALGGAPSGAVVVGLPGSVASVIAGPLHQMASKRYPKVRIRLVEALSGVIEELLALGRLDIGLLYNDLGRLRKAETPLCQVNLVLVAPRGDKLSLAGTVRLRALDGRPLILPSSPHALRRLLRDLFAERAMRLSVPFEVDSLSTMTEVVAAGGGYTIAPYSAVIHAANEGRIQVARIINPSVTRVLVMMPTSKGPLTSATKAISDLIIDAVARQVSAGHWIPVRATAKGQLSRA